MAFYVSKKIESSVLGYNPINDRMTTIQLQAKPTNITLIQVYAPTSASSDDEIEAFYGHLQETNNKAKSRDTVAIMGDFNAKVGSPQSNEERKEVRCFGLGDRNEGGK